MKGGDTDWIGLRGTEGGTAVNSRLHRRGHKYRNTWTDRRMPDATHILASQHHPVAPCRKGCPGVEEETSVVCWALCVREQGPLCQGAGEHSGRVGVGPEGAEATQRSPLAEGSAAPQGHKQQ